MKIIAIGDLHGKDCWQEVNPGLYDKIIFMGDYADAPDKSNEQVIQNFEALIAFKLRFPEKVVLLLGNHDMHYAEFPKYRFSGFNDNTQPQLTGLFSHHINLFSIAWQYGNFLFTHAGISQKYLVWLKERLSETDFFERIAPLADQLNAIHKSQHKELVYVCGVRRGGFYPHGGPIWADDSETQTDHLEGFHQVVGHNKVYKIRTHSRNSVSGESSTITYIDVLEQKVEFYELNIK